MFCFKHLHIWTRKFLHFLQYSKSLQIHKFEPCSTLMDTYVANGIFPTKVISAKTKPTQYTVSQGWEEGTKRKIGIGKISQITGRRDSEGIYSGNAEKWGWDDWSLLLIWMVEFENMDLNKCNFLLYSLKCTPIEDARELLIKQSCHVL